MRLVETEEMKEMWEKIKPYLLNKGGYQVSDDAPEEIKEIAKEYARLRKELWEKEMELI